jgi:hypothetical protein
VVGVTAIATSVAAVAVSVAVPDTLSSFAVIVASPTATAVARPVAATVTLAALLDVHATCDVRSLVVASLYTPVAVSCTRMPTGVCGLTGVTSILLSVVGGASTPASGNAFGSSPHAAIKIAQQVNRYRNETNHCTIPRVRILSPFLRIAELA